MSENAAPEVPPYVSVDLRRLSGMLRVLRPDAQACSLLGGEDGAGRYFENEVFEMHQFYWGDCTCGYSAREEAWSAAHRHDPDCYRTALGVLQAQKDRAVGRLPHSLCAAADEVAADFLGHFENVDMGEIAPGVRMGMLIPRPSFVTAADYEKAVMVYDAAVQALCEARGLTYPGGSEVHCTCSYKSAWETFLRENDHDPRCALELPNFRHKPTGLRVDWYKWVGRSMTMAPTVDQAEWGRIYAECVASLATAAT